MTKFFAIASLCVASFALAETKETKNSQQIKLNPACVELAEKFIRAQQTLDEPVGIDSSGEYKAVIWAGDTAWAFTFAAPTWWHNQDCRITSVSVDYF